MNLEDLTFRSLAVHRGGSEAGYFSVNPRPYAAISFRLNGSGEFTVNGKRLTASEGDVLFLPANTPYEVEYSVNRFIVIHLWDCDRFEAEVLRFSSSQAVKLHFLRLLEAQNNGASKLQMKAHVYGLLDLMLGEKWKASPSPVLSRCVAYLEENFTDSTVNVESLCRSVFFTDADGDMSRFISVCITDDIAEDLVNSDMCAFKIRIRKIIPRSGGLISPRN